MLIIKEDLYSIEKLAKAKGHALWLFFESEESTFISNEEKAEIKNWINKINREHHNDGNFFSRLKEIFTEESICYLSEGQEDRGAISLNDSVIIVRNSEFGVAFNIVQLNDNDINPENWSNYQKMLSGLKLGFNNPKDFHLTRFFDIMNNELEKKDSIKDRKVKL